MPLNKILFCPIPFLEIAGPHSLTLPPERELHYIQELGCARKHTVEGRGYTKQNKNKQKN